MRLPKWVVKWVKDDFDLEITEDTIFKALVYYKVKNQYNDEQIELESQNFLGRTTTPSHQA